MKYVFLFFVALLLFLTGCGDPQVKGTVTFDDGTPLTTGGVMFVDGSYTATGAIKPDGSYVLSSLTLGDGVKSGNYKVTVSAQTGGGIDEGPVVNLVDVKFADPATSGLTCDVKGATTYNITVTKPNTAVTKPK